MAGVYVQQLKGNPSGRKRTRRQVCQHDRVLAAGEEQHGTLKLSEGLSQNVDRFRFKGGEGGF